VEDNYRDYLRRNIRYLRKKHKLNQTQLAEKMGVAQTTVSDWETGDNEPNFGTIIKLCDLFRVNPTEILGADFEKDYRIFDTAQAAIKYLLAQPQVSMMGGYDLEKMSEDELIKFADDVQGQINLVALRYKK